MTADDNNTQRHRATRRKRPRVKGGRASNRNVVRVSKQTLKSIHIVINPESLSGVIAWRAVSGREFKRQLVYTPIPEGAWKVQGGKETDGSFGMRVTGSDTVDPVLVDRMLKIVGQSAQLFVWVPKDGVLPDAQIDHLHASVLEREIELFVSYGTSEGKGEGKSVPSPELDDTYFSLLRHPEVATIFLEFLEHFSLIEIEDTVALKGIEDEALTTILSLDPGDPAFPPSLVARMVTTGVSEYLAIGEETNDWFAIRRMLLAIFYQRKRNNPQALANQLMIAVGFARMPDGGKLSNQVGIKLRGRSLELLYDRDGMPLEAYVGYKDLHYRPVDLSVLRTVQIDALSGAIPEEFIAAIRDEFIYDGIEMAQFAYGVCEFYTTTSCAIYELYGGEIGRKAVEMLPVAIGFFIGHALAAQMMRMGGVFTVAGVLTLAGLKVVGWFMQLNSWVLTSRNLQLAGRELMMMERLHRKTPDDKGGEQLTRLSQMCLQRAAHYLIEAISEFIVSGVVTVGLGAGSRAVARLSRHLKPVGSKGEDVEVQTGETTWVPKNRSESGTSSWQPELRLHFEGDSVSKVRATRGTTELSMRTQEVKVRQGAGPETGVESSTVSGESTTGGTAGRRGSTGRSASGSGRDTVMPDQPAASSGGGGGRRGRGGGDDGSGSGDGPSGSERPYLRLVRDGVPVEETGVHAGRRTRSGALGKTGLVKVEDYPFKTRHPESGKMATDPELTGMPETHLRAMIDTARQLGWAILVRLTQPRGVQHVLNGHPPKGKDLLPLKTDPETGKVTARNVGQRRIAQDAGYFILRRDGRAFRTRDVGGRLKTEWLRDENGRILRFNMDETGAYGEKTNVAGQVIDGPTRKAVVGDYDIFAVIDPSSPGRSLVLMPEKFQGGDYLGWHVEKVKDTFNTKLKEIEGIDAHERVLHGGQDQWKEWESYLENPWDDAIVVLPDGRVGYVPKAEMPELYRKIGRRVHRNPDLEETQH